MNHFASQQGRCTRYINALLKQPAVNKVDTILLMNSTNVTVTGSVHSKNMSYSTPLRWCSALCVDRVVHAGSMSVKATSNHQLNTVYIPTMYMYVC